MNVLFSISENFWDTNPLFELHFKDIKDEDVTKNKSWSSYRMWCIALRGALNSPIGNLTLEEQLLYIYEDFLIQNELHINNIIAEIEALSPIKDKKKKKDKDNKKSKKKDTATDIEDSVEKFKEFIFDNDLDAPLIQRFINITHPKAKKLLRAWEDKLEEWQSFIEKTKVSEETYEMLGKMMVQSHTMWKQYYVIKKESDAELESQGMGGAEKSFLEEEDY